MSDRRPCGYEIRQMLLHQAESILERNAQMNFASKKQWNPVTTEDIITEAEKLYQFVQKKQ